MDKKLIQKVKRVVAGAEVKLLVRTVEGYRVVAGQESSDLSRVATSTDITTKADQGKRRYITLAEEYTITTEGYYVVNDLAFEALEEAFYAMRPIEFQLVVADLYTYVGSAVVTDLPITFAENEATYRITLVSHEELEKKTLRG